MREIDGHRTVYVTASTGDTAVTLDALANRACADRFDGLHKEAGNWEAGL